VHRDPAGGASLALSLAELDRATAALARLLLARGLRRGERVALRPAPGPAAPAAILALARAGLVAVPVSTRVPPAAVPALLGGLGCRLLLAPADDTVALDGADRADPRELLAQALGAPAAEPPPFDPAADAVVVFTSGSSGRPKAALHAAAGLLASAAGANAALGLGAGDGWLLSLPLWHVGGLGILFRCALAGATILVPAPGRPAEEEATALGATHLSLVPTQLVRLLRAARPASAGLRAILLGGGATPEGALEEASRRGLPVVSSYGSTELASVATATRPGEGLAALRTAGRPLPGREIAVSADGEILARGETLFRGYLTGAGLDPARDARGWFHTGDLGSLDGEGRLLVHGRRDAMFISGGENVHPEEIERALLRHPAVEEAVVVPVPHEEFGERPIAFVRTAGPAPDDGELAAFLRRSLAGFQVPDRFLPWPALPEGAKPLRSELRALARRED